MESLLGRVFVGAGVLCCLSTPSSSYGSTSSVLSSSISPSCPASHQKCKCYFLYAVNPGEGFNLNRDVYMKAAITVKEMRKDNECDWVLVLPPWRHLYHWRSRNIEQNRMKWANFFHIDTLNAFVPVIEFDEFLEETQVTVIDKVEMLKRENCVAMISMLQN